MSRDEPVEVNHSSEIGPKFTNAGLDFHLTLLIASTLRKTLLPYFVTQLRPPQNPSKFHVLAIDRGWSVEITLARVTHTFWTVKMNQFGVRRSSRLEVEIPITLIGSDTEGKLFLEHTHTILISRHGAGVVSKYKLSPEQEILIRLQDSDKEGDVRVIGQIGAHSDSYVYGVAFLQSQSNFWGREFEPLTGSENKAPSLTLECARCGSRESLENSDLEADVYAFNQRVVRHCKGCGSSTVWKVLSIQEVEELISSRPVQEPSSNLPLSTPLLPPSSTSAGSPENKRKDRRTKVKMTACVRRPGFEDDVVICEDMSRGGVRIKSRKTYLRTPSLK